MEILDLPLKAKWYNMIESGEKPEEYREFKEFWIKRLFKTRFSFDTYYPMTAHDAKYHVKHKDEFALRLLAQSIILRYTHIRFRYGYTKKTMLFECKGVILSLGNPTWGAPDYEVFILKLGKRCDIDNIK